MGTGTHALYLRILCSKWRNCARSAQKIFGHGGPNCPLGWAEKWEDDILKCADVDYYGTIYIKQGSIEKNRPSWD